SGNPGCYPSPSSHQKRRPDGPCYDFPATPGNPRCHLHLPLDGPLDPMVRRHRPPETPHPATPGRHRTTRASASALLDDPPPAPRRASTLFSSPCPRNGVGSARGDQTRLIDKGSFGRDLKEAPFEQETAMFSFLNHSRPTSPETTTRTRLTAFRPRI